MRNKAAYKRGKNALAEPPVVAQRSAIEDNSALNRYYINKLRKSLRERLMHAAEVAAAAVPSEERMVGFGPEDDCDDKRDVFMIENFSSGIGLCFSYDSSADGLHVQVLVERFAVDEDDVYFKDMQLPEYMKSEVITLRIFREAPFSGIEQRVLEGRAHLGALEKITRREESSPSSSRKAPHVNKPKEYVTKHGFRFTFKTDQALGSDEIGRIASSVYDIAVLPLVYLIAKEGISGYMR